jgi:hypothetical protein
MKDFKTYFEARKIPYSIISKIESNSYWATQYACLLIRKGEDVPLSTLEAIMRDSYWSLQYVKYLIRKDQPIPDMIAELIMRIRSRLSELLIWSLVNYIEIPEKFWKALIRNHNDIYLFLIELEDERSAENDSFQTIPDFVIDAIAKDPYTVAVYTSILKRRELEVPPIIAQAPTRIR